jgi:putative hydrolase of the HAD superfamily
LAEISPRELVDYWFARDSPLDEELLEDLAVVRQQGIELHLATLQEHHRARFLWERLGLRDRFVAMDYSPELGAVKSELAFYRAVEERTGLAPEEHCLIDDRLENIEMARRARWHAFL